MRICVLGLWHLGTVTAACLASVGHDVVGLDADLVTIDGLSNGKAPLFEPRLDDLLQQGLAIGKLRFSSIADDVLANAEVLWVTYDTPVDDEDRADTESVIGQIESALPFLPIGATVLVSSQLPVGSIRRLEMVASEKFADRHLGFAYSPENLRLGKALDAFLKPDRIVVGARSERDRYRLEKMLMPVSDRIEWMSVESAEMTKHAINSFLATSVTFANEIASICELVGADAKEVERGLKTENRIGPKAYLSPGGAFAGGTLARDINFLSQIAKSRGLPAPLLASVKPSNDEHKKWAVRRLLARYPNLKDRTIAVWGLTYKPGTDTLRRSLSVELCNWILEQGARLKVHDPAVAKLPENWIGRAARCETPTEALQDAAALVVATEWPMYKEITASEIASIAPNILVLDPNRFLSSVNETALLEYLAVGTAGRVAGAKSKVQ